MENVTSKFFAAGLLRTTAVATCAAIVGCTAADPSFLGSTAELKRTDTDPGARKADAGQRERRVDEPPVSMPGAGWVDALESFAQPFCSAVRIDEIHAVTSSRCTTLGVTLAFGTGQVSDGGVPVVRAEQVESAPALSTLTLDSPDEDNAVANFQLLDQTAAELRGLVVRSISMVFTQRGIATERWVWEGELAASETGELEVVPYFADGSWDAPNCHGDNGAGVYTKSGELIGLVVNATADGGCATRFELARPSARGASASD